MATLPQVQGLPPSPHKPLLPPTATVNEKLDILASRLEVVYEAVEHVDSFLIGLDNTMIRIQEDFEYSMVAMQEMMEEQIRLGEIDEEEDRKSLIRGVTEAIGNTMRGYNFSQTGGIAGLALGGGAIGYALGGITVGVVSTILRHLILPALTRLVLSSFFLNPITAAIGAAALVWFNRGVILDWFGQQASNLNTLIDERMDEIYGEQRRMAEELRQAQERRDQMWEDRAAAAEQAAQDARDRDDAAALDAARREAELEREAYIRERFAMGNPMLAYPPPAQPVDPFPGMATELAASTPLLFGQPEVNSDYMFPEGNPFRTREEQIELENALAILDEFFREAEARNRHEFMTTNKMPITGWGDNMLQPQSGGTDMSQTPTLPGVRNAFHPPAVPHLGFDVVAKTPISAVIGLRKSPEINMRTNEPPSITFASPTTPNSVKPPGYTPTPRNATPAYQMAPVEPAGNAMWGYDPSAQGTHMVNQYISNILRRMDWRNILNQAASRMGTTADDFNANNPAPTGGVLPDTWFKSRARENMNKSLQLALLSGYTKPSSTPIIIDQSKSTSSSVVSNSISNKNITLAAMNPRRNGGKDWIPQK